MLNRMVSSVVAQSAVGSASAQTDVMDVVIYLRENSPQNALLQIRELNFACEVECFVQKLKNLCLGIPFIAGPH